MSGRTGWDSDDAFVPDSTSLPSVDYSPHPNHPLNGVRQEVLDIARAVLCDAVLTKDVDAEQAEPIADAVVAQLRERGWIRDVPADVLRVSLREDGTAEVWQQEGRPGGGAGSDPALHADGFDGDPKRIA